MSYAPSGLAAGAVFDRLTVLAPAGRTAWKERLWLCGCTCGRTIEVRGKSLRSGRTRSCGCLVNSTGHGVIHGGKYTRLYRIWSGMRDRCHNKNSKDYPRYGAAGIAVCESWRRNFAAFREWAQSNGYGDHLTIDRRDGKAGYTPENCRWVTVAENSRNTTNTKLSFEIAAVIRQRVDAGETHSRVARAFGISRSNVSLICERKTWVAQ